MRRLPIYFFLDVSEPAIDAQLMIGQNILEKIFSNMLNNPYLLECAWTSVVTFGEQINLCIPFRPIYDEKNKKSILESKITFPQDNYKYADVGAAIKYLSKTDRDFIRKEDGVRRRDFNPFIFFVSGSKPINLEEAIWELKDFKSRIDILANIVISKSINENFYEDLTPTFFLVGSNESRISDFVAQLINQVWANYELEWGDDDADDTENKPYPWLHFGY